MARLEFRLPDVGEGLAEAEVVRWLVPIGERVAEDQPVLVLQTDKAELELPAPASGVLIQRLVPEGARVKIGEALFVIETAQGGAAPAASGPRAAPVVPPPPARSAAIQPLATPAIRKMARELGIDLTQVTGTGPQGRVTAEDLQRHAGRAQAPPAGDSSATAQVERIPLRGVRRRIAENLSESARTIPHVTGFHEMDAAALRTLAGRLKQRAEARGMRWRFDAIVVKIAVAALKQHPIFNASLDQEAVEIVIKRMLHIGVATATSQGLMVPVVHGADGMDVFGLSTEIDRLVTAARAGTIGVADLQGGTFTITNTGGWNGWLGTSIIPLPQVAILGVGRIQDRAVAREGRVEVRPVLPVAITFDHRVIDGEQGLLFAQTVRELVERPASLFPEA